MPTYVASRGESAEPREAHDDAWFWLDVVATAPGSEVVMDFEETDGAVGRLVAELDDEGALWLCEYVQGREPMEPVRVQFPADFDAEILPRQLKEVGGGYVSLTQHQTRFLELLAALGLPGPYATLRQVALFGHEDSLAGGRDGDLRLDLIEVIAGDRYKVSEVSFATGEVLGTDEVTLRSDDDLDRFTDRRRSDLIRADRIPTYEYAGPLSAIRDHCDRARAAHA